MEANGIVKPGGNGETVTATIPFEHVEDFRAGVIAEIASSVDVVQKDYKDLDEAEGWFPDKAKARRADLETATRLLVQDTELLGGMGANATGLTGEDVEVQADAATLAHAFEAMARDVIEPRLRDVLGCSPIDEKYAPKSIRLMERLTWAAERAADYHAKAAERIAQGGQS